MLIFTIVVIGFILLILGFIGCIIPALPGPPLSFIALLLLSSAQGFVEPLSLTLIIIMLIVTIVVTVLDYIIPAAGAKKYGSSKWGIWGAIIGMIAGMIYFPPFGMIVGAFIGAVGIELIAGKTSKQALSAGWGVFIGTILGTLLKLIASGIMTYYFVKGLI